MFDEHDAFRTAVLGLGEGVRGAREAQPPGEREEFELVPAARAVGPMRVAGAERGWARDGSAD